MISPDWLATDPIPARVKGWVRRGPNRVSLKTAYMSPEVGAGQDVVRDDWRLDQTPAPAYPETAEGTGAPFVPETPALSTNEGQVSMLAPISKAGGSGSASVGGSAPPPGRSNVRITDDGFVLGHDHAGEDPSHVNMIPPAGAQLSGRGDWLAEAETQVGRVYVWGGKDPKTGFDCSGYAAWVNSKMGRPNIGASTMTMYPNTQPVSDPQPGDLVFYNMNTPDPHLQHVAVYIGNGRIIQSGGIKDSINIASVNQPVGSAPEFRRPKGVSPGFGPAADQSDRAATSSFPQDSKPTDWFTYVDAGKEVMKITWANGQTTYHVLGSSDAEGSGTVMQTGTLGAGQDDEGDGTGDDQTEWQIPTDELLPTRLDNSTTRRSTSPPEQSMSMRPPISTRTTGSDSTDSSPSDEAQTQWRVPPTPGEEASPDHSPPTRPQTLTQAPTTQSFIPTQSPNSSPDRSTGSGDSSASGGIRSMDPQAMADQLRASLASPESSSSGIPNSGTRQDSDQQTEWSIPDTSPTVVSQWPSLSGPSGVSTPEPDQSKPVPPLEPIRPQPEGPEFQPSDKQQPPDVSKLSVPGFNIKPPEFTGDPLQDITGAARKAAEETSQRPYPGITPTGLQVHDPRLEGAKSLTEGEAAETVGPAGERVADWFKTGAAKAAGEIPKNADDLWDPVTHTFQSTWDRIMPDDVHSRAEGAVSSRYLFETATGAAAAGVEAKADDSSDPNYWPKVIGAGVAGLAGAHVLAEVVPAIVRNTYDRWFEPTRGVADVNVRTAVAGRGNRIVSAKGQGWMWGNRIQEVLGKPGKGYNKLDTLRTVEETGKAPIGAPREVQQLIDDMVKYTEDTRDEGQKLGYIRGDITTRPDSRGVTLKAYMPRVLEDNLTQAKQAPGVWHGKLNPNDNYTHMRQHVSLYDGQQAGVKYVNSISDAFAHYVEHVSASRANALFVKDLKKMAPNSVKRIRSTKQVPKGWVWGGEYLRQWQNVAFSPELDQVLKNLTRPGAEEPAWKASLWALSQAKHALLAPSLFHLGNEVRQVFNATGFRGLPIIPKTLAYVLHPASERRFWANPSVMDEARRAMDSGLVLIRKMPDAGETGMEAAKGAAARSAWGGATGAALGYMDSRRDPTLTDDQRIQRGLEGAGIGAIAGLAGGEMSRRLWRDAVPYMKLMSWQILEKKHGAEAAARFVNSVYGGQNLEAIARSRKVQDALRTFLLAPDWQEGWIRQIGNAFLPGPVGDMNRAYWTRAAVTSAFVLEGLNLALSGHFTGHWEGGVPGQGGKWVNDNGEGHGFQVEATKLWDDMGWDHTDPETGEKYRVYVDALGVYRSLLEAPHNIGQFASSRESLLPEAASVAVTGKDWRGKDIAPRGADPMQQAALRAGYLAARMAPVSTQQVMQNIERPTGEPAGLAAAREVIGFREARDTPLQQQVRERTSKYQDIWNEVGGEEQFKIEYSGALREAERQQEKAFDPSKTGAQIVQEVQRVQWPSREERLRELEPEEIAADPVANAEFVSKVKEIPSIGIASGGGNADPDWSASGASSEDAYSAYWSPAGKTVDEMLKLPADAQDRVREAALVKYASSHNIEPNVLRDSIKAHERGMSELPKLPGITSEQLDEWVKGYRSLTDDDPQVQAEERRGFVDGLVKQYNVDPKAVYERIKLRNLPITHEDPNEPGISSQEKTVREMVTSYERAQDVLYNSRDPMQHPKYAGPDGKAFKGSGPDQWAQWDDQVKGATTTQKRNDPAVKALVQAQEQGNAGRLKSIYQDKQANEDYQRWFGVGRNMDAAHWQQYVTGEGKQFTDYSSPAENRRRTRTLELWKVSTPKERQTTKVKIKLVMDGSVREVVTTLDVAKKHIERVIDKRWRTSSGIDLSGMDIAEPGVQQ